VSFPFAFMRMQGHWRQPPPAADLLVLVEQGGGETRLYDHPPLVEEEAGRAAYSLLTQSVQFVVFGFEAGVNVDASRYLVVDLWDSSWALCASAPPGPSRTQER
jgi:hypothetical protein